MADRAQIQALADQIVAGFPEVQKVILFGSHAYGAPTADSDVDLLVVMEHAEAGYRAASRIRISFDVDFPLDLIVRSPAELADQLEQGDGFVEQIISKGKVLYEAEHGRVDREGRRRFRRRSRAPSVA